MPDDPFHLRKAPRQARSRVLVDSIVEAAGRILPGVDLDALTTRRLAETAGVSVGSLYQYFPSKEAIVGALIDQRAAADLARVRRLLDEARGRPLAELVTRTVSDIVALHRDAGPLYRAMLPLVARVRRHRHVRELVRRTREQLRAELELRRDELRRDRLDLAVFIAGHALEACVHAALDEHPAHLDDPAFARELVDLITRYLLADPPDDGGDSVK